MATYSFGRAALVLAVGAALSACSPDDDTQPASAGSDRQAQQHMMGGGAAGPTEQEPFVRLPAIDAYHEGQKIWFLHTEVSSTQMAQRLTAMVDHPTIHAPRLGEIDRTDAGALYVFTNGVSQRDAEPWGGGPFHYQIDVFDSVPGQQEYTPLRNPHLVTWSEGANARVLHSEAEILHAQRNGELSIERTDVIVNAPVVSAPTARIAGAANRGKVLLRAAAPRARGGVDRAGG